MGVLFDYFRAADAVAAAVADGPGWSGPLFPRGSEKPFDGVDAKEIDPHVALGQLVGFVRGVPYSPDLVTTTPVRPMTSEDDDPSEHGVEQLNDEVRDTLASVTAEQVPDLAARWAGIEEFGLSTADQEDGDFLVEVLTGLADLSRRAQGAGDHLYCWWSL